MKHYGKLYAAAAAGFMALNVLGAAPVFAEDGEANNAQATITVNVGKSADAYNPVGKPQFSVAGADVQGFEPAHNVQAIYSGVDGGLEVTIGDFNHANGLNNTTATASGKIAINSNAFANQPAGQYVYTVTLTDIKTDAEGAKTTDGVSVAANQAYTVNVFKDNDGNLLMTVAKPGQADNAAKSTNLEFTALDNVYTTYSLTVKKVITGNQSVATDTFPFTVDITASDTGETKYNATTEGGTSLLIANNKVTAVLSNNDTIVISGLSAKDAAAIKEEFAAKTGYTATTDSGTVEVTENGANKVASLASAEIGEANKTVTFTNTKVGTVPTGILMTAAPYAALVGLGAIFAGFFFRRKRED